MSEYLDRGSEPLQSRLQVWFDAELHRAEHDLATGTSRAPAAASRTTRAASQVVVAIAALVVVAVAIRWSSTPSGTSPIRTQTSVAPEACVSAAINDGGTVAAAFDSTVGAIRRLPAARDNPQLSAYASDEPAVVCYIDGQIPKGPPPPANPSITLPPSFDRAVLVVVGSDVLFIAAGYRDSLPIQPPPSQVALQTQPAGALCMDALTGGELVADPATGVGLGTASGPVGHLRWPAGWTAWQDAGSITIVDANGAVIAHVGDTVSMGGGGGSAGEWWVCPPIHIVAASAPSTLLSTATTNDTTPSQAAIGPCGTADLRIAVTNTGAAAGNVGGYLLFENTSAAACTMQGAPTLTATTAAGAATQARVGARVGTPFPTVTQAPLVVLLPGDNAFAAFGGSDNSGSVSATCPPPYHTFHVAPPGDATGVDVPAFNAWLGQDQPSCAGIVVTVISSASEVEQFTDLSSLRP
jgi:hypothetical protein